MKTTFKSINDIKEKPIKWHLIDAEDKVLGRVSSAVSHILLGKNKVEFVPFMNLSDKVVVINASKIKVTGNKETEKTYYHHTGFPGGIKSISYDKLQKQKPGEVLKLAVKGMLPNNALRKHRLLNLYIYEGAEHPHTAQITNK